MKGIKIKKQKANEVRKILINNNQINSEYKLKSDENNVYIPLIDNYDITLIENIKQDYHIIIEDYDFLEGQYKAKNFMEYLNDKIPEDAIENIRKSFDTIGDIVILEIPPELENEKKIIGEAVLKFTKRRSVYYKKSKIQGVTRTRKLEFLAGEDNLETIHKEYGIRFKLNPSTVYFSPRLATERARIVNQVQENETVIDFFAGIGSFPISIAHVKKAKIYSIDINPEAYKYVNENMKLNKLVGEVIPIEGDIRKVIPELPLADRIIMNLPGTAKDFLDIAVNHLNKNGILNYYEFSSDYETVIDRVKKIAYPRETEVLNIRKVKSQSPGVWHIGLDMKIK
ncbi:class I SAM-dependent methyltransferase family protein [Methanosphaera sp. WGK6]|uniref:class I SAM-dependent methyltransferase n=1 Tax=Methanosphaera sp. WGK6 TaxID=1561964 RepID=UPI00084C2DC0|nr:class I SAM-dependent methyltransferase family protein [Methanosphaera sp. WGK6]OED30559.1 SAM-dependent methyltransferase [Methanosphaera sp. WGK6]